MVRWALGLCCILQRTFFESGKSSTVLHSIHSRIETRRAVSRRWARAASGEGVRESRRTCCAMRVTGVGFLVAIFLTIMT
ncbi:TPA_asm: hypothetical protein [Porphyromonas phage phage023a_KCOM2797]|uniref:Secreted protein n=1 Tax=Porphyromonas phage phage023a_KCOM2797 TaxID=3154113 RepID=A0AAT9JLE7_9CAUD